MTALKSLPCITAGVLATHLVSAQEQDFTPTSRISVGARLGFNVDVSFSTHVTAQYGPATGGTTDRIYDNGSVKVDSSGNTGNQTWNWSYADAAQVDAAGGLINFTTLQSSPGDGRADDLDPAPGAEITGLWLFTKLGRVEIGLEAGATWGRLSFNDSSSISSPTTSITDAYALGGLIPPAAPYSGSFDGPGPLIGDSPVRTTGSVAATLTGNRRLEGDIWGLKFGPALHLPINEWFSFDLSGGPALAYLTADFRYAESVTAAGLATPRSASESNDDVLVGGYIRAQMNVLLSDHWSVFGGAEYQIFRDFDITAGSRTAEISLGGSIFAVFGVGYWF